jgi:hypothetical protein
MKGRGKGVSKPPVHPVPPLPFLGVGAAPTNPLKEKIFWKIF